jgi:hypothetical protein
MTETLNGEAPELAARVVTHLHFGDSDTQVLQLPWVEKGLRWLYVTHPLTFADMMMHIMDFQVKPAKPDNG